MMVVNLFADLLMVRKIVGRKILEADQGDSHAE